MKTLINEFVEKYDFFTGKSISYNQYIEMHKNISPILSGGHRGMQSLISVNAWTTSINGSQNILYLPTSLQHLHCAKLNFENGISTSPHTHNYIELIYILEGSLSMNIAGKKYTIRQGEICLVNTNAVHFEYLYAEETAVVCLGIDDAFFSQYDSTSATDDYALSLKKLVNQKRSEYLYIHFLPIGHESTLTVSAIRLILDELMHELPGKKRLLIGFTERIVDLLVKEYQIRIAKADKEALHTAVIESLCGYIQNNIQSVTVSDISRQFHYNPDHINRLFKREKGITISHYIQECRMHKAFELLISTDFSVEAVSLQCGYHNMGFFYQKFKESYGATPHQIRQMQE